MYNLPSCVTGCHLHNQTSSYITGYPDAQCVNLSCPVTQLTSYTTDQVARLLNYICKVMLLEFDFSAMLLLLYKLYIQQAIAIYWQSHPCTRLAKLSSCLTMQVYCLTSCIILLMFLNNFSSMLLLTEKAVHIILYATGQVTQLLYQVAIRGWTNLVTSECSFILVTFVGRIFATKHSLISIMHKILCKTCH